MIAVFEASESHLGHGVLFVRRLLRREEGGVSGQGEVNTGEAVKRSFMNPIIGRRNKNIRDKVRLELVQIDVEGDIKAERRGDG